MDELYELYKGLYGDNDLTNYRWSQLVQIIETAIAHRPADLKREDKKGSGWYLSEKMVGMMLYVDRFSKDLFDFENRIDYLAELGITYVHFMPLLKSREGNNDGGYAVSDYLEVEERLGTMKQLEKVVKKLKSKGIRTCIDFVLNHTAKEHVWVQEWKSGDPDYNDMYLAFDDDAVPKQ